MHRSKVVQINNLLKRRLLVASALIFIILFSIVFFSYVNLKIYKQSQEIALATRDSISILENTAKNIRTVESNVKGHIFAKTQVPPIAKNRPLIYDNRIYANIDELKKILNRENNPNKEEQINHINELERLIQVKLDFLEYFTQRAEAKDIKEVRRLVIMSYGNIYITQIEDKIEAIKILEQDRLFKSRQNRDEATKRTKYAFAVIAVFASLSIIVGYFGIKKSINSRQEAEQSLIESEGKLRNLTERARDGLVTINLFNRIIEWNKAAEDMFGWKANEAIGQNLNIIIPEKYREGHRRGMERYAITGQSTVIHQTVIMEGLRRDGSTFPLELNVSSWKYSNEWYFSAFLRDITSRVKAETSLEESRQELERSNTELEHFAYIASHDLQEPLRMVASYCELLKKRYSDKLGTDGVEMVDFAVDGANRMKKLIQSLLTYSRASRDYKFYDVDLNEVCRILNKQLSQVIEETNSNIICNDLPIVEGEVALLTQLFQNLILNGIKFRKKHIIPEICIDAERINSEWVFKVKDNGIGIDPKFNDKLFVIFQRLHSREEYEGTGIGLALCKKIVEKHGGRIWIESELGRGTTVLFTLPVIEDKNNV